MGIFFIKINHFKLEGEPIQTLEELDDAITLGRMLSE